MNNLSVNYTCLYLKDRLIPRSKTWRRKPWISKWIYFIYFYATHGSIFAVFSNLFLLKQTSIISHALLLLFKSTKFRYVLYSNKSISSPSIYPSICNELSIRWQLPSLLRDFSSILHWKSLLLSTHWLSRP